MACITIGAGSSVSTEPTRAERATVRPRLARDITFIPGPLMCPAGGPNSGLNDLSWSATPGWRWQRNTAPALVLSTARWSPMGLCARAHLAGAQGHRLAEYQPGSGTSGGRGATETPRNPPKPSASDPTAGPASASGRGRWRQKNVEHHGSSGIRSSASTAASAPLRCSSTPWTRTASRNLVPPR